MKKNATRIIALALIALMCLALLPMTAFASEDPPAPETGAPQVVHESNIVNGQPGRISGLTADMEYANAETDWSWRAAPAGGVLEVAQSCTTYFRYVGVEDEARKSTTTLPSRPRPGRAAAFLLRARSMCSRTAASRSASRRNRAMSWTM